MTRGHAPDGNRPPLSVIKLIPGISEPTGMRPARKTMPTIKKVTSAMTLIMAAQNSISPNHLTDTRFRLITRTSATKAMAHCGITSKLPQ